MCRICRDLGGRVAVWRGFWYRIRRWEEELIWYTHTCEVEEIRRREV